ncbi:Predicted DNA-binding transcriptional regulator YafY, contains an HTH and WYL domains [Luteibacter sp. 22Crub2.1]|nr:Predicted DNA-binding transcriptional regulator YafY, contains an HTH and WYL domains [Luteibacter sp. 22Crub2.1]
MPRAPRQKTVAELSADLAKEGIEVSRRTVERDLQNLSARFPLVADDSSKPFGWSWMRDANIEFTPRLSIPQGIALLLAQVHLRPLLPDSLMRELMPIFYLARQEMAHGAWNDWHRRTAVVPTAMALLPPVIDRHVLNDVHEALAMRRQLVAEYRSKGARESREVTIHPLGLVVRGSVQYLVCTLFDYDNIRQLALHRLSRTRRSHEQASVPEGFDFQAYAKSAAKYESQGLIKLVARFSAGAAEHLRETPLSSDQQVVAAEGGEHVDVSATVELDQTLRWWLKAFGSNVAVIEPQALRDEMRRDAMASVEHYGGA